MCGILGANFFSNSFENALKLLTHRGPDNISWKRYNDSVLGHTRLAIIDLSEEANQPMEFDNIVIIFNGEIYNYKELINDEKLNVKTKSDTEVILRLYQKYQYDFLHKLNGMFSFCIYDVKKRLFFCARDRYGKKPFFYYFKNDRFIFASEIKSILALLDYIPDLNFDAFYEYLTFWTPLDNKTFYKEIKKLPAGHYLIFKNNSIKIKKWYNLSNRVKNNKKNEIKEILKKIEELLFISIKLRLRSDVEVASLLSGGIDSSLISCLYSVISEKPINTFSVGYDEYKRYDETNYAKKVAKHIKSHHHEIIISKKDFIEVMENFLYYFDEPFADSAAIPTFFLTREIKRCNIKVALSGEGSDEIFLGYDRYFYFLELMKKKVKKLSPFNLTKEWEYEKRLYLKEPLFRGIQETFTERQKEIFIKGYKAKPFRIDKLKSFSNSKMLSLIDFQVWLQEVLMAKIDRMSMANSVEVRAPFLDFRLVEYVLSLPDKVRLGSTNKFLLKKIATKFLPEEIVNRRKKGFSSPFIEWLNDYYNDKILEIIFYVNKNLRIFNENFIKFLYKESKEKRFKQHLWCLFLFCLWYKKVYL